MISFGVLRYLGLLVRHAMLRHVRRRRSTHIDVVMTVEEFAALKVLLAVTHYVGRDSVQLLATTTTVIVAAAARRGYLQEGARLRTILFSRYSVQHRFLERRRALLAFIVLLDLHTQLVVVVLGRYD